MGKLTTHVLDTACGKPGAGILVQLFSLENGRHLVTRVVTDDDGRTARPLLDEDAFVEGTYEMEFSIGDYFRGTKLSPAEPPFLGEVVIRVTLAGDGHYHVPLLVSPWSYSTYRGS